MPTKGEMMWWTTVKQDLGILSQVYDEEFAEHLSAKLLRFIPSWMPTDIGSVEVLPSYLGGVWTCWPQETGRVLLLWVGHLLIRTMPFLLGKGFQGSDMWLDFNSGKFFFERRDLKGCWSTLSLKSLHWTQPFQTIFIQYPIFSF